MIAPQASAAFVGAMKKVLDIYSQPYDAKHPVVVYTPKHGSWLNMAEIEINVMVGQCLNRRIDNVETVRSEVAAWQQRRDNLQAKINWQFTTTDARVKLKRLYPEIFA